MKKSLDTSFPHNLQVHKLGLLLKKLIANPSQIKFFVESTFGEKGTVYERR